MSTLLGRLLSLLVGVSDSYWRPTEQDLLEDYLKAVDYLTINREDKIISDMQNDIMQKLVQREKENEVLKEQIIEIKKTQDQMIKTAVNLQRLIDWLHQDVLVEIERLIREHIEPDPADGSSISAREYGKRRRQLPELAQAVKKLQRLRLASIENNKKKKGKKF